MRAARTRGKHPQGEVPFSFNNPMAKLIPLSVGPDKQNEIVKFLTENFNAVVKARSTQVDSNLNRWMDNYSAKPLEAIRTTPFYRASNFVPQLIRMHTDILSARVFGLVLGTKPMWKPQSLITMPHEDQEALQEWIEYESKYTLRLTEILDTSIFRAFKTGCTMLKGPWVEDSIYKKTSETSEKEIITSGLDLRPCSYEDVWVNPITIQWLRDADQVFHRLRLTKDEVKLRVAQKKWEADAADIVMANPEGQVSLARDSQATEAGVTLTPDVVRPCTAVEATFKYQLEAGKVYELVVTFNPNAGQQKGFLRGYYNPYEKLKSPYVDLKFMPREDFFYGYSIPEILEQSQEEQAQIHNARRDSNTIGNIPTFKKKKYADSPNPSSEWYPGKVFELEAMDDMDVLNLQVNYNAMIEEERFLLSLAEQYTGVQPPMQGYGSGVMAGKRGIYSSQGTLAMLAEGNRRLDIYLYRARYPFHDIGNLIYQSYKQFRPSGAEYTKWGDKGEAIRRTFNYTEPEGFPGFFFNIGASDASANREVDRTALLLMANTMGGYYRQVVEASATLAQLPDKHPLKEILLTVLSGAKDLANRLLFAFDVGDRKRLLPDVREILGGGPEAAAKSADRVGLPGSDDVLSIDSLRNISQNLGSVTSANNPGAGGGR
jgi:hypothetical protein